MTAPASANLGLRTVLARVGPSTPTGLIERRIIQLAEGLKTFNLEPAIVHAAAEIAAMEPALDTRQRAAMITLGVIALIAQEQGSTRFPVTGYMAREPMRRILAPLCQEPEAHDDIEVISEEIEDLLACGAARALISDSPGDYKPLLYLAPYVYVQRIHGAETRLAECLRSRLGKRRSGPDPDSALADVAERPPEPDAVRLVLADEQRAAIALASRGYLTLISGGPGSGKTSIILALLRVLTRIGIDPRQIVLAAPTGKAAMRMTESIREGLSQIRIPAKEDENLKEAHPEAKTLHRLLGYSPTRGTFSYHRNNQLAAAVVIVDECSMIDLTLLERLAAALRDDAQLVLLGDADQLPSVAAGAVFRDLLAASARLKRPGAAISARLSSNYRFQSSDSAGRSILSLALAINEGRPAKARAAAIERQSSDELCFEGVERLSDIDRFIERWYSAKISDGEVDRLKSSVYPLGEDGFDADATLALGKLFRHSADSRLLCVTRVLPTGSDRINEAMHERALAASDQNQHFGFLPGEPIIVVRNDYERMLFNGDQGTIVRTRNPRGRISLMAIFPRDGKFIAFHLAGLHESLELAYATTVHKAQGSEFQSAGIILPAAPVPVLTRELLYTAASRARHSVTIAGAWELVETAIACKTDRFSGLSDLLQST